MLLIARLTQANSKFTKTIADVGVDALLMPQEIFGSNELKQIVSLLKDVSLGAALGEANFDNIAQITKSGGDFIVFNLKTPIELLEIEEVGKILKIEPSLDSGLVKAINNLSLPVDGVLITTDEPRITVEYFLTCQRFAELLDKPVLVTLPPSISANQLSSLWEAGIDGVVVSSEQPKHELAELRKTIDNLPRRTRQRGKVAVVLPPLREEVMAEVGEEEEEI